VLWSRTVSVPYALSLCCAALGPLLLVDAHRRRAWPAALAAWQLMGLSFHFSPLGAPTFAACALGTLRAPWRPWPAVVFGAAHGLFVLRGVLAVPRGARQGDGRALREGLVDAARMLAAQMDGVATLRHAAGASAGWERAGALALLVLAAGGFVARGAPSVRRAVAWLGLCAVATPLMLVPARAWSMPTVDADRYGFAVLAPLALLVGAIAGAGPRAARAAAWLFVAWVALGPTSALCRHALRGGGADLGLYAARGGGRYRGWQRPAGGGALVDRAFAAVRDDVAGGAAVVAYTDYAFHPLRLRTAERPELRVRHHLGEADPRPGERVYWLLWRDEALAADYAPRDVAAAHRALRRRVFAAGARVVTRWSTPDGAPWCELVTSAHAP
jgi:hypothetical protein